MENLYERIIEALNEKELIFKYSKTQDVNMIILPYRGYYKERVEIFVEVYNDMSMCKVGFCSNIDNIQEKNTLPYDLLDMNKFLLYGAFSLDIQTNELRYSLDYNLVDGEEFDIETLLKYIKYCLRLHKELIDKKIIENENSANG